MTPQLYAACRQAVHVITMEGRIIRAGRAVMFVLEEIGYPHWLVRPFTWPPLVWLTEMGYRLVANHRPFFGRFLFTGEVGED
jgi:predicted DCC family thiol-disulfide oxidoreductase YuxK